MKLRELPSGCKWHLMDLNIFLITSINHLFIMANLQEKPRLSVEKILQIRKGLETSLMASLDLMGSICEKYRLYKHTSLLVYANRDFTFLVHSTVFGYEIFAMCDESPIRTGEGSFFPALFELLLDKKERIEAYDEKMNIFLDALVSIGEAI